jgi:hypothetical protein
VFHPFDPAGAAESTFFDRLFISFLLAVVTMVRRLMIGRKGSIRLVRVDLKHHAHRHERLQEALQADQDVLWVTIMSETTTKKLPELLQQGVVRRKLKILTWDPESDVTVEAFRQHLKENEENHSLTLRQVREALTSWKSLKTKCAGVDIEVRKYPSCPTMQGLIVGSREDPKAWAVIELIPYATLQDERPGILLQNKQDPELLKLIYDCFDRLWNDSKE